MRSKKAIISDIITFPLDKQVPLLLNFQNGNLQAEASQSLHFTTAINKETNEKRALLAANGNIYHGCIKERTPTKSVNTLIAVRNKRTNKVRLIQVQPVSMIHSIYDEKENKVNESSQSNESRVDLLIKNFGDRRANRNFERAQKKKLYIDSLKHQLKQTVDNTEILKKDEEDEETEQANEKRTIRPAFNKYAEKLEDIFSLYDLIPKKLMESLNQEAEDVLTTKIVNLPITSNYVKKRIRDIKISNNPSSEKNLSIVKALIYMDALCQLIKVRKREWSKVTISKITKKVENDIRVRFFNPAMALMFKTSYIKDKAICYYIVLALITSPRNYEVDINVLMLDLSISRKNLIKFANYVSAQPNRKTDVLCLKLPAEIKPMNSFRRLNYV